MEKNSQPIRVVHITKKYINRNGGIRAVIHALSMAQCKLDAFDVWIYECETKRIYRPDGKTVGRGEADLVGLRPHLAVFHAIYLPIYYHVIRLLKREQIPYAIVPHSGLDRRAQAKSAWKKRIGHFVWIDQWIKNAVGVMYLCEEERDFSRIQGLTYAIVTNTIPRSFPILGQARAVNHPIKVLVLSRIDRVHKGFDRLLDTLEKLPAEQKTQIEVEIYGNGSPSATDWLNREIEKSNHLTIRYGGPIYGDAKIQTFQNADIFLMFSRYEGLPLTLYEAAASGLPLVVTEGSNRRTWVEANENGWVLSDKREDNWAALLAKAIEAYAENPLKFKQNTLKAARALPSWEQIAESSIEPYRKWSRTYDE